MADCTQPIVEFLERRHRRPGLDAADRRRRDRRRLRGSISRATTPSCWSGIAASRSTRCSTSSTRRSAGARRRQARRSSTAWATARARTSSCGRWRSSSRRRRKETGVDQQLGPLNPYERRIVHMAVAEDAGVSSESIGDAFAKTVHHFGQEVAAAAGRIAVGTRRTSRHVLHRRHHRRDRHAARARRHRRRADQRS